MARRILKIRTVHPALSVIFFTVFSGVGFGLLFLAGAAFAIQPRGIDPVCALLGLGLGVAFAGAGLVASLSHLGQPQRAWRALSQWRTSWLSREGVAALACFVPAVALYALVWHNAIDMALGGLEAPVALSLRVAGVVLCLCAVLTVFCTARIYSSLQTIAAWHNGYVLPVYLSFALLGGTAWLWLLAAVAGGLPASWMHAVIAAVGAVAVATGALKWAYWRYIDRAPAPATTESATGLGSFGAVHGVEAPHTEENYLTREMGFVLARKHAARLRVIALLLFALLPAALALVALAGVPPAARLAASILAALGVAAGTFAERWLFFAEARHVVMRYYGR
jgi:DMSO reductase anchor subunit